MNISTGGPHILLFERDQQLTALIISEFQLAGYECHAARTAVEVFDALARYPVRIVLVDLAQAAAARREFWVALDTQRRGRGIQVLTFRCSNIAGYGLRDLEERSQNTAADLDIDGMSGLMKLVDEVRNRVPGANSITNTIPRIPRVTTTSQPSPTAPLQRAGFLAPVTMNNGAMNNNGNSFRTAPVTENTAAPPRNASGTSSQTTLNAPIAPTTTDRMTVNTSSAATNGAVGAKTASYTDKIRAVLYPNQRNWSTQGNASAQVPQEQPRADMLLDGSQSLQMGTGNPTVLQRLANGQAGAEESGLAQLSRLAQANYITNTPVQYETSRDNNQQPVNIQPIMEARFTQSALVMEQGSVNTGAVQATSPEQVNGNIGAQPLRASPIQDIPIDRAGGSQAGIEGGKRPGALSHTNYGQQQVTGALTPLASITTPSPASAGQANGTVAALSTPSVAQTAPMPSAYPSEPAEKEEEDGADDPTASPTQTVGMPDGSGLENIGSMFVEPSGTNQQNKASQEQVGKEADIAQNRNTMLFDIMQSLPPMPPIGSQPQSVQAQILNGRATRSLGSVLLAGHLVPQNRLEVAQNIQRMLRGVDLNYQLGEILLMFKLLTPDQLLAASLVSYGMITTTQVSALGRIRQELHSIGLEYDLESLLILFRILTPEQLREAKSGMQG